MSNSVPNLKLAYRKRLRSYNGSKRDIQSGVEKDKEKNIPFVYHVKQNKKNVSSDMSKEKKTKASMDCNCEKRKRDESSTLFKKVKRMQSDYNKKIHTGKTKEKNCADGKGKKRITPFSFFKVTCNNFKEYLSIPPKIAPKLEDLTNHHVYLEDSEGNFSEVRLSVVNGFLAFHQGWNNFVLDHLIKWGEFLLFEYTTKSTFSVRVFGRDSRERLHFNVGRKRGGVRKKEMHTNMSYDDCYFSDEYPRDEELVTHHVTVHAAKDPKRVDRMVGSGPVPLDNRNGNEAIRQDSTKDMSTLRCKQKSVILITDSGSSTHEDDRVNLIKSTAAPGGFRCLEKWKNRIVRDQAVLDGAGLVKPESTQETDNKSVDEYGAVDLNPGDKSLLSKDTHDCSQQILTIPIKDATHPDRISTCEHDAAESSCSIDGKGTCAFLELQPTVPIKNPSNPDRKYKCGDIRTEVNDDIDENGTIATKMGHLEPMGSIVGTKTTSIHVCANNAAACQSGHSFFKKEDTISVDFSTPAKPEILESGDRYVLKVNLQFCIPTTTKKWLELPRSLSNAVRQRKQDRTIIMLKDPIKRLWPVFYHENSIFVGFTAGWIRFAAANNLQCSSRIRKLMLTSNNSGEVHQIVAGDRLAIDD